MKIKALTIKQPWCWAIAEGHKLVENRSWRTSYRGPLAIHAGKAWDLPAARWIRGLSHGLGIPVPPGMDEVPRGAVVAVARLVGVCARSSVNSRAVRCECGLWATPGQFHWQLADVASLPEPFFVSGKQGLWEIDLPDFPIGGTR